MTTCLYTVISAYTVLLLTHVLYFSGEFVGSVLMACGGLVLMLFLAMIDLLGPSSEPLSLMWIGFGSATWLFALSLLGGILWYKWKRQVIVACVIIFALNTFSGIVFLKALSSV